MQAAVEQGAGLFRWPPRMKKISSICERLAAARAFGIVSVGKGGEGAAHGGNHQTRGEYSGSEKVIQSLGARLKRRAISGRGRRRAMWMSAKAKLGFSKRPLA